ncbi:MAG: hypothetical protein ACLGSD_05690 [Acidobacteriota bacterium]
MAIVPVMWSIWGVMVVLLLSVWIYRARLERDEEDQIFLDDSFSHEKAAQDAIVARVNKVQPVFRASLILVLAASLWVVAYYAIDITRQFRQ